MLRERLTVVAAKAIAVARRLGWIGIPLVVLYAVMVGLQIWSLSAPIIGQHDWRQADTFSVAYNLHHESPSFFHPRFDNNRGRSGIMAMEAPVLGYAMQPLMFVLGDTPQVARLTVWLLCMMGVLFGTLLLRQVGDAKLALGFLVMLAVSPAALFQLRQILPDPVYVMLSLSAAYFFYRSRCDDSPRLFSIGLALYSLAVLTKMPALAILPAMWVFSLGGGELSWRRSLVRAASFSVPIALSFGWYAWGEHLNATYNEGVTYMSTRVDLTGLFDLAKSKTHLEHIFGYLFAGYEANWCLAPAVLVGLLTAWHPQCRRLSMAFLVWLLCASAFMITFHGRLWAHWYNATVALPPIAYFGAVGLRETYLGLLVLWSGNVEIRLEAALVLVAFMLTWVLGGELKDPAHVVGAGGRETWVVVFGLRLLLLSVPLAIMLARTRHPALRKTLAIVATVGVGTTFARAAHDGSSAFLYHSAAGHWRRHEEDRDRLRQTVDRYSTRQDLFVIDRGTPVHLHMANRKGWAVWPHEYHPSLDYYRDRGARFFLHVQQQKEIHPQLKSLTPLVVDRQWTLYCLDREGCPVL